MSRLRKNFQLGVTHADLDASTSGTSEVITGLFAVAPSFATITPPDIIALTLEPSVSGHQEIVHLTAYTAGSLNGTITRGQEGTSAPAHVAGSAWGHDPTAADFTGFDYTGSGSPEGVVAAAVGKNYYDTTNGALYVKFSGSGNTGWSVIGGFSDGSAFGVFLDGHAGAIAFVAKASGTSYLSDVLAYNGTGNGFSYYANGTDGEQRVQLQLGPSGEFSWHFDADGTTTFPGEVVVKAGAGQTPDTDDDLFVILGGDGTTKLFQVDSGGEVSINVPDGHNNGTLYVKMVGDSVFGLNSDGTLQLLFGPLIKANAPVADGSLGVSEMQLWYDDTHGAAKLMVKAKDSNGDVVTEGIPLTNGDVGVKSKIVDIAFADSPYTPPDNIPDLIVVCDTSLGNIVITSPGAITDGARITIVSAGTGGNTVDGSPFGLGAAIPQLSTVAAVYSGALSEWVPLGAPASPAGVPIVRKFPFAFNTAGILTGAALYTPTIGDVLLDAWIEVVTPWDGTTPQCDFGTFLGSGNPLSQGMYSLTFLGPINVGAFGQDNDFQNDGLLLGNRLTSLRDVAMFDQIINVLKAPPVAATPQAATGFVMYDGADPYSATLPSALGDRIVPLKFSAAHPIKVCVSQNGQNNGADPGSTQGAAVLYLVTATPA